MEHEKSLIDEKIDGLEVLSFLIFLDNFNPECFSLLKGIHAKGQQILEKPF